MVNKTLKREQWKSGNLNLILKSRSYLYNIGLQDKMSDEKKFSFHYFKQIKMKYPHYGYSLSLHNICPTIFIFQSFESVLLFLSK
jgi:hypothetical protein